MQALQVLLFHSCLFNILPGEWTGFSSSSVLSEVVLKCDMPSWLPRAGRLCPSLGWPPWHTSTWGALSWWLPTQDLQWWLPKCLQLPKHWQPQLSEWLSLSIFSSSKAVATNTHQWASHITTRASSHDPSLTSLKWLYVVWILSQNSTCGSGLEVPAGLCLSLSSGRAWFCLCWRHSLMESRNSWQIFSSISASQRLLPGNLHSWYISLYTPLIFSLVDLGPTSSMADGSALRPCPAEGCHQLQQMAQSCSFLPVAAACRNILYRRNGWCNLRDSHHGYSSTKASASSHLSISHMDTPSSFISFLAAAIFAVWLSYVKLSSVWKLKQQLKTSQTLQLYIYASNIGWQWINLYNIHITLKVGKPWDTHFSIPTLLDTFYTTNHKSMQPN